MCRCKKICITNRKLVNGSFIDQIEKVCQTDCDKILLREKDMDDSSFMELATKVKQLCDKYNKELIIHHRVDVCKKLEIRQIHFPMPYLLGQESPKQFIEELKEMYSGMRVSASVHAVEEAILAQSWGIDELIAGHIFDTDCKKGIPGRGISFLEEVCKSVEIPVYAIGGMNEDRMNIVCNVGAKGICMMSQYMV